MFSFQIFTSRCFFGKPATREANVYSFTMTCYEVITGFLQVYLWRFFNNTSMMESLKVEALDFQMTSAQRPPFEGMKIVCLGEEISDLVNTISYSVNFQLPFWS
jgi:hypothetical protein